MKIGIPQLDSTLGDFQEQAARIKKLDKHFKEEGADLVVYPSSFCAPFIKEGFDYSVTFYVDAIKYLSKIIPSLAVPTILPIYFPFQDGLAREFLFINGGKIAALRLKAIAEYEDALSEGLLEETENGAENYIGEQDMASFLQFSIAGKQFVIFLHYDFMEAFLEGAVQRGGHYQKEKIDVAIFLPGFGYRNDYMPSGHGALLHQFEASSLAKRANLWLLSVNGVGGYDEEVYIGSSYVITPWGELQEVLPFCEEDVKIIGVDFQAEGPLKKPASPPKNTKDSLTYAALRLATRDFVEKAGYQGATLLLTGDLNTSALAALAVDALGPTRVQAVCAPLAGSSLAEKNAAYNDAIALAKKLRISYKELSAERLKEMTSAQGDGERDQRGKKKGKRGHEGDIFAARAYAAALASEKGYASLSAADKTNFSLGHDIDGWHNCIWAPFEDLYCSEVASLARGINSRKDSLPPSVLSRLSILKLSQLARGKTFSKKWKTTLSYAKEVARILGCILEDTQPLALLEKKDVDYTLAKVVADRLYKTEKLRYALPMGPTLTAIPLSDVRFPLTGAWLDRFAEDEEEKENIFHAFARAQNAIYSAYAFQNKEEESKPASREEEVRMFVENVVQNLQNISVDKIVQKILDDFDPGLRNFKTPADQEDPKNFDDVSEALESVTDTLSSGAMNLLQDDDDFGHGLFSNN